MDRAKYMRGLHVHSSHILLILNYFSINYLDCSQHTHTTTRAHTHHTTVKLRTAKARNCFSAETVVTMAFQLCMCAQKKWISLNRADILLKVIEGVKFVDGIEFERIAA